MRLSRARSFSPLSLLALFTLCLSTASAAVIGIDFGTEYIKAVLVKPGAFDIVLTKDSRRKEAAALSFKPVKAKSSFETKVLPERNYGADAVALSARFPGDTFQNIKSLLGIQFSNEAVRRFQQRYPAVRLEEGQDGKVALRSATFVENETPFLVEELLAMELQNVATNAETMAKQKVKDVVLTVPPYWTVDEKDALQRSAELADLNVVALITDGLAVGLDYAKTRTFPTVNEPGKTNKPEYHVVYDMGAGGTTATVLRMQGRMVKDVGRYNKTVQEVQVVGTGWDQTLGGDALNTIILDDMIDQLADKSEVKKLGATRELILKDGRTISKLWKESERMRQVLSANIEAQASFEALYHEDVTFKYKLKRTDLEKMAESFIKRLTLPIDQAMHAARLEFSDIESIIVHGGAQRAPFVQTALAQALEKGDKVRNNVNSDESAAFGAALLGASYSSSFKVREVRTTEAAVHDVWVSWKQDGKDRKQKIFTESSAAGKIKQLPLKTAAEELTFEVYQQVLDGDNMRDVPVLTVKSANMTKAVAQLTEKHGCAIDDIKTQFEVWLDPMTNVADVVRGSVNCEVVDDKKGGIVDGIKGFFGGKKDDQQALKDNEDSTETIGTESASASSSSASTTAAGATDAKEPKKKIETVYIGILPDASKRKQMSHTEMMRVRTRLSAFTKSDVNREQRAEALNQLESYTYRVRDLVENDAFVAVSTESQRKAITDMASAAGDWIYGEGAEALKAEFDKRLKELKDLVTPVENRRTESGSRSQEIELLEKTLKNTKSMLDTFKESAEVAANEAASAAESAVSSVSSAASSVVEEDYFADLEDETTISSTSSTKPLPTPIFKPEDFDSAYEKLDKAQAWLKEKLAAQVKLSASDEPAFLVADIRAKADELSKITTNLIQKQLRAAQSAEKPKSKTKSAAPKTKKVTLKDGDSTTIGDETATASSEASSTTHDEL